MTVNRCAARGCGCSTRAGEMFRGRHGIDAAEDGSAAAAEPGMAAHAAFRARLAAGDHDALLGHGVRTTLHSVAADASMDAEIGALRLTLIRLLDEERDPARLAAGVARVAGVALQAARLRQEAGSDGHELRAMLLRGLAEMEEEQMKAAEETRRASDGSHGDMS